MSEDENLKEKNSIKNAASNTIPMMFLLSQIKVLPGENFN